MAGVIVIVMRIWMAVAATSQATSVEYINGRWLEAGAFRDMTVWVVDGRFSLSRPARVDSVVDLAGGFALPPFGDAHTHVVGDGRTFAQDIERLLADGIFYIKNTNSTHRRTAEARALVNLPTSVDARFAFGGLTSPGGHPAFIYNYGVRRGAWPGWTQAQLDGEAFYTLRDSADLERRWPEILRTRPDFLKLYLEGAERHGTDAPGPRGLDPALIPLITRRAHAAGLETTAHVTSAFDVRTAVNAGVQEITHLPLERLADSDVALLRARRTRVVTTVTSHRPGGTGPAMDSVHADNLRRLHAAGVHLAIGTDNGNVPVVLEADAVCRLGVMSNAGLLAVWTYGTVRTIFPGRSAGLVADGYEASFIVLDGDPIADFANVRRIRMRVKQGVQLPGLPPASDPARTPPRTCAAPQS